MYTKKKTDKKVPENDKTSTLEETKKYIINKLWLGLPRWLRVTVAIIVIISTPVIATKSLWYSTIYNMIHPPVERIIFRGYVYSNTEMVPLKTRVQLIDQNENQLTDKQSDDDGLVVFNIPDNEPVKSINCLYFNKWQSYNVDNNAMKNKKKFIIITGNNSIQWK